ncbi:hypothetical protein Tco_0801759 [Tanacetum coccineum]|uniref:Uncharacterized protein n=1 Tax=Tanacetum coccineum TaxID=301880 RepID=A0ABQ4ZZR6_9ASTR
MRESSSLLSFEGALSMNLRSSNIRMNRHVEENAHTVTQRFGDVGRDAQRSLWIASSLGDDDQGEIYANSGRRSFRLDEKERSVLDAAVMRVSIGIIQCGLKDASERMPGVTTNCSVCRGVDEAIPKSLRGLIYYSCRDNVFQGSAAFGCARRIDNHIFEETRPGQRVRGAAQRWRMRPGGSRLRIICSDGVDLARGCGQGEGCEACTDLNKRMKFIGGDTLNWACCKAQGKKVPFKCENIKGRSVGSSGKGVPQAELDKEYRYVIRMRLECYAHVRASRDLSKYSVEVLMTSKQNGMDSSHFCGGRRLSEWTVLTRKVHGIGAQRKWM